VFNLSPENVSIEDIIESREQLLVSHYKGVHGQTQVPQFACILTDTRLETEHITRSDRIGLGKCWQ